MRSDEPIKLLSELEARVLTAFCKGMSSQRICENFGLSHHALEMVLDSAQNNLNARNRLEMIYRAVANSELDLP